MERLRLRSVMILITSLVLLGTVSSSAVASPGGGSNANAKFCLTGGGTEVQRTDWMTFTSEETCVTFAALLGTLTPVAVLGETPDATPALPDLPQGPLGEQIAWLLAAVNTEPDALDADEVGEHFTPDFLAQVPAPLLVTILGDVRDELGASLIEPGSLVTTRERALIGARFILVGETGFRLRVSIVVDRESELITGLFFELAPTLAASPVASPVADVQVTDEEVSFQSGADTIYGSFMSPASAVEPGAAALIISGSGPTDRNGNSGALTSMNTNLNLATTLAASGIPSLRYDKLGSGTTGLGAHAPDEAVGLELFLQEARDAVAFLAGQPNVDPARLILVGHSEGALFALLLAHEMSAAGTPPAALILVSPLGIRYLDLLTQQLTVQLKAAVAAGQIAEDEASAAVAELAVIVDSLRTTGELPETIAHPVLAPLFPPTAARFLAEADATDPANVAAALPVTLPVLVLHGGKDEQVSADHINHLMAGFAEAGNEAAMRVDLADANHLMKVIAGEPNAAVDYANPDLPFSAGAIAAIAAFLRDQGLAR